MKKLIIPLAIIGILSVLVLAYISSPLPTSVQYINNINSPNMIMQAQSNLTPAPASINYYFNGAYAGTVNCNASGFCNESKSIAGLADGNYTISYMDADGIRINATGVLVVDKTVPTSTSFNFAANSYNVTFTSDCADTNLNTSATTAYYRNGSTAVWQNFTNNANLSATPFNIVSGDILTFRGYCVDFAGNVVNSTSQPNITFPSVPATLTQVDRQSPNLLANVGVNYSVVGAGGPTSAVIKLTYDSAVTLQNISVDNGAQSNDPSSSTIHYLSFTGLTDHIYTLNVTAKNTQNNFLTHSVLYMNVSNAAGVSTVAITVVDTVPVVVNTLSLISSTPIKTSVQAGDFAVVKYNFSMASSRYLRAIFNNANSLPFNVTLPKMFCSEDYNTTTIDIVSSPVKNTLLINTTWAGVEGQRALNCTDADGVAGTPFNYAVYIKFPIANGTAAGSYGGTLTFGLYANEVYP